MVKKIIEYEDFEGHKRKEEFRFNLTKAELIKLDMSFPDGIQPYLSTCMKLHQNDKIWEAFEKIIDASYGIVAADGRRFMKNADVLANFKETEAYSELIMSFFEKQDEAYAFINGLVSGVDTSAIRNAVQRARDNGELKPEADNTLPKVIPFTENTKESE